jgi:hypothetical protein
MNQNNDNNNNLPLMVGILIFDQIELLDIAGPFEVFSVTRLNQKEERSNKIIAITLQSNINSRETRSNLNHRRSTLEP